MRRLIIYSNIFKYQELGNEAKPESYFPLFARIQDNVVAYKLFENLLLSFSVGFSRNSKLSRPQNLME
jgi:hypothetical protein